MSDESRRGNYKLRPAKSIERKMLAEAFSCLSHFDKISSYRYIGFGALNYSDFTLFHRSLGISRMISIEHDVGHRERYAFNRPFCCIDLCFGESTDILPTLPWRPKTILWLDYEKVLDPGVLVDVKTFVANAPPGSVLVVTVNAKQYESVPGKRVAALVSQLGDQVPANTQDRDLGAWGLAFVYRDILDNVVKKTLLERNGGMEEGTRIRYKQLFNFQYSDETKMLTVGGLLYGENQEELVTRSGIGSLYFIKTGADPFVIDIPKLTLKEIRYLDAQLPLPNGKALKSPAVSPSTLQDYSLIYRYFPAFVEAEL